MSPFWFSLCRLPCLERSPAEPVGRSVQGAAEGWANDAERLSQDPTFRLISSEKVWDQGAALTSRLQTFVTEMLAEEENFAGLAGRKRAPIGRAEALESDKRTVLDMDPTEIPVRRARAERMQLTLRFDVLSPAAVIQSRARLPGIQVVAR